MNGKKWYNYFVSTDENAASELPPDIEPEKPAPAGGSKSAAQTVAELAAAVSAPPKFSAPVTNPASFDEIYQAAEIRTPPNGYTIFKISDMLKSEHIRSLPVEIKKSSVLLALDAAGVKLQEVIEDAVRRDKALDTFETVQERALEKLEAQKAADNKKLQEEADRVLSELRTRIQANNDAVAKERERLQTWRLQKQQEEQRIADAVAPFVSPNPITTGRQQPAAPAAADPPSPGKAK